MMEHTVQLSFDPLCFDLLSYMEHKSLIISAGHMEFAENLVIFGLMRVCLKYVRLSEVCQIYNTVVQAL